MRNFAPKLQYIFIIMDIKDILEAKIKDAGLSKKTVAERMGIASQNLNSMITAPSWPTLERLALALGTTIPQLISESTTLMSNTVPCQTITCPKCGEKIPISVQIEKMSL